MSEPVVPDFVFDANTDGPWPRTRQELIGKVNTLHDVMQEVKKRHGKAAFPSNAPWPVDAEYVRGVHEAAYWTLGVIPTAPMTTSDAPVCNETVAMQMEFALEGSEAEHPTWRAFRTGAAAWLLWITGNATDILWPVPQ